MAYRRRIIARAMSFYQHQPRLTPSFSYITSNDREESPTRTISTDSQICSRFPMNRNSSANSSLLSGNASRVIGSKIPASYGLFFHRNLSNVPSEVKDVNLNGLVGAVGDKVAEAAPAVNEVAIAAADSFAPVAAFQYLIDYVHFYTGFECVVGFLCGWASIAATALLLRFIHLPHLIHQLKLKEKCFYRAGSRQLKAMLQELTSLMQKPRFLKSDEQRAMAIFLEFMEIAGEAKIWAHLLSDGSACFLFFAILNMAENVPSFVTGGTLWFTDLTTPDHSMRLPLLFALTYWSRILLDPKASVQRGKIESMFWPSLATAIAVIAGFPSAIYCYGISTNLFSIAFGITMKDPRVRKSLGITLKPPSTGKNI